MESTHTGSGPNLSNSDAVCLSMTGRIKNRGCPGFIKEVTDLKQKDWVGGFFFLKFISRSYTTPFIKWCLTDVRNYHQLVINIFLNGALVNNKS